MPNRLFAQNPVVLNNASGNLELVPKQQLDSGLAAKQSTSEKDAANGYLGLDSSGYVPTAKQYGATTSTYGILKVSGDLTGNYDSQTVVRTTVAKTATYTATTADRVIIFDTTSGAMTCNLHAASTMTNMALIIKKLGGSTANPLTIDANSTETIDGALTEVISVAGGFRELISDGTKWHIIGGKVEPIIVTLSNLTTAGQNISIDASVASIYRIATTSSASTCTLAVPTNPIDGDAINVEVSATVATSVTINASILLTTGITSPIAVPIGKKLFLGLRTIGSTWYLLAAQIQS
jgi:hypothetical protein